MAKRKGKGKEIVGYAISLGEEKKYKDALCYSCTDGHWYMKLDLAGEFLASGPAGIVTLTASVPSLDVIDGQPYVRWDHLGKAVGQKARDALEKLKREKLDAYEVGFKARAEEESGAKADRKSDD